MDIIIEQSLMLLIIAIIVALVAHRLKLPYTVGLVITGIALKLMHVNVEVKLTHEFIFDVILPPLLFEAAINIHWKPLRRDMFPIILLSTIGIVIAAAFVAWGIVYFLQWPLPSALIFGVLIAATDPVAVIAMFKDSGASGRLRLLVESESLFNDGTAAVMFAIVLAWAQGSYGAGISILPVLQGLSLTVGGGIFIGFVCAMIAILVSGHSADHLQETALTTACAYGSFLLAEHLHISGVLATVTAGLFMGNLGVLKEGDENNNLSERGRAFIIDFWEFAAFLANSLIFLLIGLRVAVISFPKIGVFTLSIITLLVIIGRALAVYPLCMPLWRSRWSIPLKQQHILWWGGLRGALALALALSLPDTIAMHDEIVIAAFGVVAFSVLVQGITMPLLLR